MISPKTRRIAAQTLTVLFGAMVLLSAIFKLIGGERIVAGFQRLGAAEYLPYLALCEIGIAVLLLYPRTTKLGVVLALAYFSGALATEITHAQPLNAILMIVLSIVVGIVRVPEVFLLRAKTI